MKRTRTKNRCLVTCLTLVAMLMTSIGVKAQTVHIGLDNGSLLTGVATQGNDSGWEQGFSTLWRHEQLSLSMMASDRDKLEDSGEVGYPSNVYAKHSVVSHNDNDKQFCIIGGRRPSFIVVSLPKGYRITGYTIVLSNDLQGSNFGGRFSSINDNDEGSGSYGTMRFYETAPWETNGTNSGTDRTYQGEDGAGYNADRVKNIEPGPNWQGSQIGSNGIEEGKYFITQALDASGNGNINTNDTRGKEYTISRTAQKIGTDPVTHVDLYDMGNQLYFRLVKDYCFYGITIKEFRLEFTAEGTFAADVVPDAVGTATSCVASPFKTSKIDIGEMRERQKTSNGQSYTHYAFDYDNIDDVQAYNYLYQDDAVNSAGAPEDVANQKNIRPVEVDGQMLYALKSDTYFIETPIEIETSGGKAPVGYRIVGALFTPLWGTGTTNFTPGPYKLKIYKRDGSGLMRWTYDETGHIRSTNDATANDYIEIADGNDTDLSKVIDIGLCNNDAIKFEIEMTGENAANTQALVQVKLLLQALDPYIDKMDIVCTEAEGQGAGVLHLTQSFTADDFSVSGGKFVFYVPTDYIGKLLNFTFSDLYSKYGDETYYGGGSGSARYSFVRSPYFIAVDGNGDGGLYNNTAYSPDHTYTDKIYTIDAGNIRFKFNNAEDLEDGTQSADFEEYPFSVTTYLASTDPGDPLSSTPHGPNSSVKGKFIPVQLTASDDLDENSGTFFVFTADETRWNIAPTNNWQHRFYAFYRMEIEVRAKTFTPDFTWTRIYDKTSYAGKDTNGKEIDLEKSMWGVTLDVSDTENGKKVQGYLTYQEIINAINAQIANSNIETPEGTDQILYIDGTPLYAMLNSAEDQDVIDVTDLQPLLAKNALIFLPENTTSLEDNVAYVTSTGFVAGKDIVLTDKYPFFTPYEIQVASANHATYKREKSGPNSGLVTHGTVVLPFTLRVNEGKHVNDPEDGFEFNVRRLTALASPTDAQTSENNYYSDAYFAKIEGTATKANEPYMVEVTATPSNNSNYSFVVSQAGSTISATPSEKDANGKITKGHKNFQGGESVTNSKDGGTLTNYGTYSGMTIPRNNNVYYFNKDKYVSSKTLAERFDNAIIRPFRAYYSPDEVALYSKMIGFYFVYDLFSDNGGITTSLTETYKPKVMTITTEKGSMLISAKENIQVKIMSANGVNVDGFYMNAGEQKQVSLPSGIYIINNTKILVK